MIDNNGTRTDIYELDPEKLAAAAAAASRGHDRRQQARWLILIASMAGALYLCWLMLAPFVNVLMWAAVLTFSFAPVHRRILARTGKPNLSAGLATLFVMFVIGVPMVLVTWAIVREIVPAVGMLQSAFVGLLDPDSRTSGPMVRWLGEHVDLPRLRLQISEQLGTMGSAIASRTVGIVGDVVLIVVQALFVVFVMFYLFRDGKIVRDALASAIPLRNRETRVILARVSEVVGASINGVLVIATIQGTLGGLAFAVLGLPSAPLWGVVMIFLSLIPIAGAFVIWIPAAIYLAVTGSWIKALLLTLFGVFVISLVDNFLRPRLVGKRAKLHELFIFFAVLGGLHVFGLIGLVLGPVVLAIALSLFETFRHPDASSSLTSADMFLPDDSPYRVRDKV
jgi:predicted PurR-regulated permease PerM